MIQVGEVLHSKFGEAWIVRSLTSTTARISPVAGRWRYRQISIGLNTLQERGKKLGVAPRVFMTVADYAKKREEEEARDRLATWAKASNTPIADVLKVWKMVGGKNG